MKRFIQIVYDNSGSMCGTIGGEPKYQIAQQLFETEILPAIALPSDRVLLRTFGSGCQSGTSQTEDLSALCGSDRGAMLRHLKSIACDRSTPLYYAVYDAIMACKGQQADEYRIFVLTDGDDTCGIQLNDLFSQELLDRYVRAYHIQFLLVAFAVDQDLDRNNLSALSSRLGGQVIHINSGDRIQVQRSKIQQGLLRTGYVRSYPLAPCFTQVPGPERSWAELEASGCSLFHAELLQQRGYLSFEPDGSRPLSGLQAAELNFLCGLCFASNLPDELVKAMLSQLQKPYHYSFDCIYWDFGAACWKYFPQPAEVLQLDNPDAGAAEQQLLHASRMNETINYSRKLLTKANFRNALVDPARPWESFQFDTPYRIEDGGTEMPSFRLVPVETINIPKTTKLHLGEVIEVGMKPKRIYRSTSAKSRKPRG